MMIFVIGGGGGGGGHEGGGGGGGHDECGGHGGGGHGGGGHGGKGNGKLCLITCSNISSKCSSIHSDETWLQDISVCGWWGSVSRWIVWSWLEWWCSDPVSELSSEHISIWSLSLKSIHDIH